MNIKFNYAEASPKAYAAVLAFNEVAEKSGLEQSLMELVKTRASQINQCAFCIDMHTRDARKNGESEARLYLLSAWREAPHYTPRERAALAWTEALTRMDDHTTMAEALDDVRELFTDEETANLGMMICVINTWNRLGVGFGLSPAIE